MNRKEYNTLYDYLYLIDYFSIVILNVTGNESIVTTEQPKPKRISLMARTTKAYIQHDNSGVGYNWREIKDIPLSILYEIEEEICCCIEDGAIKNQFYNYRASNGLHYRWKI